MRTSPVSSIREVSTFDVRHRSGASLGEPTPRHFPDFSILYSPQSHLTSFYFAQTLLFNWLPLEARHGISRCRNQKRGPQLYKIVENREQHSQVQSAV